MAIRQKQPRAARSGRPPGRMAIPRRTHAPSVPRSVAQPAPTERRPPGVKTASARPPTTGAAAGFTRGASCGLCEAAYNNRSPAGFTDGGRRSVDAAGTRTAAHRRVGGWSATRGLTLGCIGFATRNRRRRSGALHGSTRPRRGRRQGCTRRVCCRETRGLGEATSNGYPQGSRGAHPAALARPPPRVHPEGVLLGMPRGARGGPAVSDVQ